MALDSPISDFITMLFMDQAASRRNVGSSCNTSHRSSKKGHFRVQAWILLIFGWFSGPIFRACWLPLDKKTVHFSYLFLGCFFWWLLGLNLGVWKTKHLAREVLQKSSLAGIGFLMISGSFFYDFGCPWDQFSWFLLPWRMGWNLITFPADSGVTPDLAPLQVGGNFIGWWALSH